MQPDTTRHPQTTPRPLVLKMDGPIDLRVCVKIESQSDAATKATLAKILAQIANLKERFIMDQAQTQALLEELKADLAEAGTEIVAKVTALEAQIAKGGVNTPAVDALLGELTTMAQGLADLANAPPAPPPEEI